ncbi:MAG: hypothetical protein II079_07765 [Oscillospiraceae bacterium]|nr:hypothetical protein [Oscillospiraceae bacterium]
MAKTAQKVIKMQLLLEKPEHLPRDSNKTLIGQRQSGRFGVVLFARL